MSAVTPPSGIGGFASLAGGPWAITSSAYAEVREVYERHLRSEHADFAAIEARIGQPLQAAPQREYTMLASGVAAVRIDGVISPKANMLTAISGGTSAQLAARNLAAAAADPAVRSIVLIIDSPGGSVIGVPELAQATGDAAAVKPLVAISDGVVASGAYWVAAAADRIYITGPTVHVGSIGVVATHRDTSGAQAAAGTRTTEITAGKYKRIASPNAPLSKEGKADMQAMVDHIYSVFVESVAANRGVSVNTVLSKMADGRVFIGQQAVDAGLVDGFKSLDSLVSDLALNSQSHSAGKRARRVSGPSGAASASAEPAELELSKADQVALARKHVEAHGVTFVEAMKKLGFAR